MDGVRLQPIEPGDRTPQLTQQDAGYNSRRDHYFPVPAIYSTALLTTTDPNLTGDLSGRTLSATISVSGDAATFKSQNGDGCDAPATVRFYFRSPSASG